MNRNKQRKRRGRQRAERAVELPALPRDVAWKGRKVQAKNPPRFKVVANVPKATAQALRDTALLEGVSVSRIVTETLIAIFGGPQPERRKR